MRRSALSGHDRDRWGGPRPRRTTRPAVDRLEDRVVLAVPGLSIADVAITEGDGGTVLAVFTVSLSAASKKAVSVSFATADGTALAGADYAATSGTLSFAKGQTTKTIAVPVLPDLLDEPDETFTLSLSKPSGATLTRPTARGTVLDNDPAPAVSVGDVLVSESGAPAGLVVTLSTPSARTITVAYATADGSATGGLDYSARSGSLTFAPGQTTQTIPVPLLDDAIDETDETFVVNLLSATNATLADAQGLVSIADDDAAPYLTIDPASVVEGDSGTASLAFLLRLSAPSAQPISVSFATVDGTARAGLDYLSTAGTLDLAPGTTSTLILVPILGDTTFEGDETLRLTLSGASNAWIVADSATGTIVDDDPTPAITIDDVSLKEGDSGSAPATFTLRLSAPSAVPVTVQYATADGAALAGTDYVATSGTVTFAPGQTSQTIDVAVLGDTTYEPTEGFSILLSGPTGATLADARGDATIYDNDAAALTFRIDDARIFEGNSGTSSLVFRVVLSAPSAAVEWATLSTGDGTAIAGQDYTARTGVGITFLAGVTEQTIAIPILGDTLVEANETLMMTFVRASRPTSRGEAIGTIINDD